jgi:hypothetical protein
LFRWTRLWQTPRLPLLSGQRLRLVRRGQPGRHAFPAIKAACPYLLDPEDVRRAFGQIVRDQKVSGIDIVCFAPPYDVKGIAAMGAAGILFEAFVHTALKKRAALAQNNTAPAR